MIQLQAAQLDITDDMVDALLLLLPETRDGAVADTKTIPYPPTTQRLSTLRWSSAALAPRQQAAVGRTAARDWTRPGEGPATEPWRGESVRRVGTPRACARHPMPHLSSASFRTDRTERGLVIPERLAPEIGPSVARGTARPGDSSAANKPALGPATGRRSNALGSTA